MKYNQKYVKGRDGHDWLLKKNIWRRMRYRRENKKLVQCLKTAAAAAVGDVGGSCDSMSGHLMVQQHATTEILTSHQQPPSSSLIHAQDHHSLPPSSAEAAAAAAVSEETQATLDQAAIEAAVAVAVTFGKEQKTAAAAKAMANRKQSSLIDEATPSPADDTCIDIDPTKGPSTIHVANPLDAVTAVVSHDPTTQAALDAAAKLAAATANSTDDVVDDSAAAAAAGIMLDDADAILTL